MTEPEKDPITLSKAVHGIANPKNFVKLGVQGINASLVILTILGIVFVWNLFFPKKNVQTQKQSSNITFQKDSGVDSVTIVNSQDQQKQKKTVGLEGSISSEDAGVGFVKYINDNWAVVVGGRWKFDAEDDTNSVVPEIKVRYDFY